MLMIAFMRGWRHNAGDVAAATVTAKEPLRRQKRKKRDAVAAGTLITPSDRIMKVPAVVSNAL